MAVAVSAGTPNDGLGVAVGGAGIGVGSLTVTDLPITSTPTHVARLLGDGHVPRAARQG